MASTGKINGNLLGIYVNVDGAMRLIAAGTGASYTYSRQVIDATSKDNNGAKAILMGGKSVEFTFDGIISFDQTDTTYHGYDKMLTALDNNTSLTVRFSSNVVGDKYIQCTCYLESINGSAPVNAVGTYSLKFNSTGDITVGTET